MRVRKYLALAAVVAAAVVFTPGLARAQWLVTPFAGATGGGDAIERQASVGASIGYMGRGIAGFEFDFGYTPDFFGSNDVFGTNNVVSLMGNVILGVPIGDRTQVRPYVTGGAGLLRSRVGSAGDFFDEITSNDFGINAGGGVMVFFNDNVGVRGDLRYFRSVSGNDQTDADDFLGIDFGSFDFWRGTAGVTFRF
jgi:opacity protein-like surface antigen